MNNFLIISGIWAFVLLITTTTVGIDERYDYPATKLIKKLANPFSEAKDLWLSLGLIRIINNILFLLFVIGYFVVPSKADYWEICKAHYIYLLMISFSISLVIESICVFIRNRRDFGIGLGTLVSIGIFSIMSIVIIYLYMCFILTGNIIF